MSWRPSRLTWSLYAMLAIVLLLLVVLWVVVATFDWNRLRPTINARVSDAMGRPFAIQGDIHVSWAREPGQTGLAGLVPWPMLEAREIAIANPAWAKQPHFAQLDALRFRLAPLPLLVHRVEIPTLYLVHPRLDLERDAQGDATWDFTPPASSPPSAWTVDLRAVAFDRGQITVDDATGKVKLQIAVEPLEHAVAYDEIVAQQSSEARQQAGRTVGAEAGRTLARSTAAAQRQLRGTHAAYQFAWQAEGSYQGTPARGKGKIGAVLALQETDQPFPIQADVVVGDSHIALVGTLTDPLHLAALDIRLWFSGSSMARLYPLLGVTLPDTPPYATEGHLQASLARHGSHFSYQDFRGRVGGSDLAGDVVFDTGGERPRLAGRLSSQLLRFADLAPLIGADTSTQAEQRGDATAQRADKVLPVEPFRTERWRAMDADITFNASRIERGAALPLNGLSTHLVMDGGVLRLDPLAFGLASGNVVSNLRLDGSKSPMQGTIQLRARHLKLKELFPTFEPMRTSFGEINGDAALDARGNSVSALLGTATGEVKLLMNDGAISKTLLETAGLNVANIVIGKLFGDKTVKINCAASVLAASNGLFQTRLFVLDTEDAIINVNGTIDFANEKLDLEIHPNSKGVRVLSLRSPLYVKGTLRQPDVGVQAGPLILRGGGALALGVLAAPVAALLPLVATSKDQPDNTCIAVLEQMRSPARASPVPPAHRGRSPGVH